MLPMDAIASIMDGSLMAAKQTDWLSLTQIVAALFQFGVLLFVARNNLVHCLSIWGCLKLLTVFRVAGGWLRNFASADSAYLQRQPATASRSQSADSSDSGHGDDPWVSADHLRQCHWEEVHGGQQDYDADTIAATAAAAQSHPPEWPVINASTDLAAHSKLLSVSAPSAPAQASDATTNLTQAAPSTAAAPSSTAAAATAITRSTSTRMGASSQAAGSAAAATSSGHVMAVSSEAAADVSIMSFNTAAAFIAHSADMTMMVMTGAEVGMSAGTTDDYGHSGELQAPAGSSYIADVQVGTADTSWVGELPSLASPLSRPPIDGFTGGGYSASGGGSQGCSDSGGGDSGGGDSGGGDGGD